MNRNNNHKDALIALFITIVMAAAAIFSMMLI